MFDEDAFLAAIKAAPADDAPRLVYADWPQEHGRQEQADAIRAEHRYRHAQAQWHDQRVKLDPDWTGRVFPASNLVLRRYPPDRTIEVIKLIRVVTSCGLAEAKALAESLPARLRGPWPLQVIEHYRALFAEAGAETERQYVLPDEA